MQTSTNVYLDLNYLPAAASLKTAECTLCPFTWQLWSNSPSLVFAASFNALLVCPLISPPVWVRRGTYLKYNLTCDNFVRSTDDVFFKGKVCSQRVAVDLFKLKCLCLRLAWRNASSAQCLHQNHFWINSKKKKKTVCFLQKHRKNLFVLKYYSLDDTTMMSAVNILCQLLSWGSLF